MFCCGQSNKTCQLQNNTVYELQSVKFSTIFKHKYGSKKNVYTSLCLYKTTNEQQKKLFFKNFGN